MTTQKRGRKKVTWPRLTCKRTGLKTEPYEAGPVDEQDQFEALDFRSIKSRETDRRTAILRSMGLQAAAAKIDACRGYGYRESIKQLTLVPGLPVSQKIASFYLARLAEKTFENVPSDAAACCTVLLSARTLSDGSRFEAEEMLAEAVVAKHKIVSALHEAGAKYAYVCGFFEIAEKRFGGGSSSQTVSASNSMMRAKAVARTRPSHRQGGKMLRKVATKQESLLSHTSIFVGSYSSGRPKISSILAASPLVYVRHVHFAVVAIKEDGGFVQKSQIKQQLSKQFPAKYQADVKLRLGEVGSNVASFAAYGNKRPTAVSPTEIVEDVLYRQALGNTAIWEEVLEIASVDQATPVRFPKRLPAYLSLRKRRSDVLDLFDAEVVLHRPEARKVQVYKPG